MTYKSIAYSRSDGDHDLIATLNNSGHHLTEAEFTELTGMVVGFIAARTGLANLDSLDRQDAPDVLTLDQESTPTTQPQT